MKTLKRFSRMIYINYVLLKYGLDDIALSTHFLRPLRFLILFSPTRYRKIYYVSKGQRIREALEELGPIFVKFGQLLSTRYDVIPEDIIKELERLQDNVPPFCGKTAERIVTKALNVQLNSVFQNFDQTPLASASIAQVHSATLLNGQSVVVKVLRPNIQKLIERDVSILKALAALTHRYWKASRQFKPKEMVREFEKSLYDELNLMREAANASQLRRNFQDSEQLYIPEIHWPLTRTNILVMERIYGIPISNTEQLKKQGVDLKALAERGVEIFFTQVFRDCFFHADMHPGNIWVLVKNSDYPQFIAMDFGIMGSLGPKDQRYLAENFLAFFKRNYRRVAELHVESGWVPKSTRIDEFEAAIRTICEPIFERPLRDISFGQMLSQLFQVASRFHVEIQPQFLLLQKTLLNVESMGRKLYPELDLWNTAKPFLENWMKTQIGPLALMQKLKTYGPYWVEKLPELPNLIYSALLNASEHPDKFKEEVKIKSMDKHLSKKYSKTTFIIGIVIGLGIAIGYSYFRRHL